MRQLGLTVVMIPARAGSKRVKAKNLRELCGQPLLSFAINNAKAVFDHSDIYVNSDSPEMLGLAKKMGVNTYLRSLELASDNTTGDEFTIDFLNNVVADTCVMISPVCPLLTAQDVKLALKAYQNSTCDTLITCETTRMQTFCEGKAINIDTSGQLRPTQENPVVSILNWAVTIWDVPSFIANYKEYGSAYIGENRLLFPLDPLHSIKISYEADFVMAEALIAASRIVDDDAGI